jgi:hypothetical protein
VRAATLARVSLVVLAAATFFAIFYSQELKREDPLLLRPYAGVLRFEPAGGGLAKSGVVEEAHFHVRASVGDLLEVAIVSRRTGRTVAVITVPVREYVSVALAWDGRTAAGAVAAPGLYLLRVHFHRAGRTVQAPLTLHLLGSPA